MPQSRDELFWLALVIVAGFVALFAIRHVLSPRQARRTRWLPVVAGLALMLPTACATRPMAPPGAASQWDNATWGDAESRQT